MNIKNITLTLSTLALLATAPVYANSLSNSVNKNVTISGGDPKFGSSTSGRIKGSDLQSVYDGAVTNWVTVGGHEQIRFEIKWPHIMQRSSLRGYGYYSGHHNPGHGPSTQSLLTHGFYKYNKIDGYDNEDTTRELIVSLEGVLIRVDNDGARYSNFHTWAN